MAFTISAEIFEYSGIGGRKKVKGVTCRTTLKKGTAWRNSCSRCMRDFRVGTMARSARKGSTLSGLTTSLRKS